MSRKERMEKIGNLAAKYTNLYVKNFRDDITDDEFRDMFETCGKIVSCVVMRDENGKSRGFGFVSYETHDAAQKVKLIYLIICSEFFVAYVYMHN